MQIKMNLVSVALLSTIWSISFANGGPVDWTTGKPTGGISPKQQNSIVLVNEKLKITILDFNTYTVEADYLLSNNTGATKVKYGVPLYWVEEFKPKEAASAISISVAGKKYGCTAVDPIQRRSEDVDEMIGQSGDAWCVTDIDIPRGNSIPLKLKYQAKLEYEDWEYSKSARREFSPRILNYPLKPAGYWRGNPNLNVQINLGPYVGHVAKSTPTGANTTSTSMTWQFHNANLKELDKLSIEFDSTPLLQHNELALWNINANPSQRLTGQLSASSELAGPSYLVKNLMDGNPATAWCAGQQGDGKGESFTIHFDKQKDDDACTIEGIALIPGYAKSAQTYRQNDRITKMRIEDCDDPSSYAIVSWKPNDNHNLSSVFIQTYYGTFVPSDHVESLAGRWTPKKNDVPNYSPPPCLRFTILETLPGDRYTDKCVSEVAFIRNCG